MWVLGNKLLTHCSSLPYLVASRHSQWKGGREGLGDVLPIVQKVNPNFFSQEKGVTNKPLQCHSYWYCTGWSKSQGLPGVSMAVWGDRREILPVGKRITCWFVYVDPFLYAWNETNLIMVYEFLMCCIWLVSILLKVFASIFIKEFGL
jgi:hypothetical protein